MTTTRAPRVGSLRILKPAGLLDMFDPRVADHDGHLVEVVQPFGCPKNGTMRQCYVDCVTCGEAKAELLQIAAERSRIFVGLVNLASLLKLNEPVAVETEWTKGDLANTKMCRVRCADGSTRVTQSTNVPDYLIQDWRANH